MYLYEPYNFNEALQGNGVCYLKVLTTTFGFFRILHKLYQTWSGGHTPSKN